MPTATNGDVTLYYETTGDPEPADADGGGTVAFVGDVGYGAWQWGWQHAAVAGPYESLVPDLRGTGRSDAPPGPYAVADLAADVAAVLADRGVRRAHLVGAGLGGMVALRAALSSSRVRSLALIGTAAADAGVSLDPLLADPDDPAALRESLRSAVSPSFAEDQPKVVEQIVEWRAAEDAPERAQRAQAAAVEGFDLRDRLYEITVPALVFHGTADGQWPTEGGRSLAEDLPRGEFVPLDGAGHLAHVEHSRVVNDRLLGFLDEAAGQG